MSDEHSSPLNARGPAGVWGDGDYLWITDSPTSSGDSKVLAYYQPKPSTVLSGLTLTSATSTTATIRVSLSYPDATKTVYLRHQAPFAGSWSANLSATVGQTVDFAVSGVSSLPQLLVQASLDSTFANGTEVTELLLARPAQEDFELTAGNGQIRGIATNGTHMWELQKNFLPFDTDTWIRAYQISDKTFDPRRSFRLDQSIEPQGLHVLDTVDEDSNPVVEVWVVDEQDLLRVSNGASGAFTFGGRDIRNVSLDTNDSYLRGAWSDGTTVWTVGHTSEHVYAFDISNGRTTGVRQPAKEGPLATTYGQPRGMWSDGSTLWVVDAARTRIYAYAMSSSSGVGARKPLMEVNLVRENANPWGVTSHGRTLWVADATERKVFAYHLPRVPSGDITNVEFSDVGVSTATVKVTIANPDSVSQTVAIKYKTAPDGAVQQESTTTSGTSATFDLTGLSPGSLYALLVTLGADTELTTPGFQTRSKSEERAHFLKNSVVPDFETGYPWVRQQYDQMRRENVEVRAIDSGSSEVFLDCIRRRIVDLAGCELVRLHIVDGHATNTSVYLHELGHMYNAGAWAAARDNGGRAIAWLYFAELIDGGTDCRIHELYADAIMVATQSTASATYYTPCSETGSTPSAATLTMMGSVLKNEIPSWFDDNYAFADGDTVPYDTSELANYSDSYDLEQFWTDLSDIPDWKFAAVASLRDAFGGYCNNSYASFAASNSSYLRNPWRAGGCTPSAPTTVSLDAAGTVTWAAPPYDGGRAIIDYKVQWKDYGQSYHSSRQATVSTTSTLTYASGRTSGGSSVRVAAMSLFGLGRFSEASQPPVAPGKPTVSAVSAGDGELTVKWRVPASSGGAEITSYDVRSILTSTEDKSDAFWAKVIGAWTADRREYTITSLTNGESYDVEVRAVNTAGNGAWSTTGKVGTPVSPDNTLSALSVSNATLSPSFAGDVTSYEASVGYTVTQITVTASENDAGAMAVLESPADADPLADDFQVNLSEGPNDIVIKVTAGNGTTRTYTVTVTRTGQDTSLTPAATDPGAPFPSEGHYTLTFQGEWTSAVTPDGVPGFAHFSRLVGAVHNAGVSFLASGATASVGVESMAEAGTIGTLLSEVQTAIDAATALSSFQGSTDTGGETAAQILNPTLSTAHPRVTLVTMVAPSPDWFVGVSGLPLLNSSGRWLRSHEVNLYPWDAGTEEGTGFSLSNPDTNPKVPIASIRGTGTFSTEPIATLSFELQSVSTTRTVAENTPSGRNIGAPITAAATAGSTTYTLGGTDAASFTIVATSGQLRTQAALNYEARDTHEVEVTARDTNGSAVTRVTVDVTNVDEPGTLALPPTQPQAGAGYTATLTDPDIVQSTNWTWERSQNRTGPWTAVSGSVDSPTTSVYTPVAADVGDYLRASARYTDALGAKRRDAVSTNTVLAAPGENNPPMFTESNPTRSVAEDAGANAAVGLPVTATDRDPGPGNTPRYEFDPVPDLFTIDASSGQIRVKTEGTLDYDDPANRSHTVIVKASDSANAFDTVNVTIEIMNVNEPPDAEGDSASTDEDTSVLIRVLDNDSDPEDALSELLLTVFNSGTNAPRHGTVSVNEPANPGENRTITYTPLADYNGADSFTYRVRDPGDLPSDLAAVDVVIDAVNDAPRFRESMPTRLVAESAEHPGEVGALVAATDVEGDTVTYMHYGGDASSFEIDNDGQITVAEGVTFDIATQETYTFMVEAYDGFAGTTVDVTITVTDQPIPPPSSGGGGGGFTGGGGGGGGGGPSPSVVDFEWNVTRDIDELDSAHDKPSGHWSDGTTLWILENGDGADDAVYAYDLASGERVEDREFELDNTNRAPRGVWSDRTLLWVSDSGRNSLFAHDLESGERLPERDIALAARNRAARGIWSGDETMWVLDGRADALFAYDLATGELLAEYELVSANGDPRGIWSDGVTVWVSDHGAKRLFAYRLPPAPDAPAAEDAERQTLERVIDEEFPSTVLRRTSNNSPRGLWSDGDVMYVADASDGKVYSYNMPDAIDARLASLSLSGVDIGEFSPNREEYEGVVDVGVTVTTVEAAAAQDDAVVVIDPPDADEDTDGRQVAVGRGAEITITVTSADGSRTKTYRVAVADAGPSATCLRGAIAEGFSLVVSEGGSIEDLEACAESRNVTALYALDGGEYVSYILGAPEFVNEGFAGLFADGVPALTPLTVQSDGPATAAPLASAVTGPWTACLQGEIGEGFNLVVYEGGSVGDLEACAEGGGLAALYALADGVWVSYILGAPEMVNAAFAELFADGVPAVTPLVARSDSPLTASADGGDATEN